MNLTAKDKEKLKLCHPDLAAVIYDAAKITQVPFRVGETLRSLERQKKLFESGASKTMKSRHLAHGADGLSRAVDLIALEPDGDVSWAWPLYYKLSYAVKQAALKLNIPLEWGGDWESFKDGPHFQLPWKEYP